MSLAAAISQLEAEIAVFGQGTADQPAERSTGWYVLRAKVVGLQALRNMQSLSAEDAQACDKVYKTALKAVKACNDPR